MNGTSGDPGQDASAEEAWRELIARFDEPPDQAATAPWPSREDLPVPPADDRAAPATDEPGSLSPGGMPVQGDASGAADPHTGSSAKDTGPGAEPGNQGRVVWRASRIPPPAGTDDDDDERYVPPPPAPLPKLDPVAKGAWTAMLAGPAYLLAATFLDWPISGWQALLAIVAFVGGFAVLVTRMGDRPSRSDGDDNGAVL